MNEGVVVKISGKQTAQVNILEVARHYLYGKVIRRVKKVACHFKDIELNSGDKVLISGCRPYSKTKKHIVVKKLDV